jgi:hypothetical protein
MPSSTASIKMLREDKRDKNTFIAPALNQNALFNQTLRKPSFSIPSKTQ